MKNKLFFSILISFFHFYVYAQEINTGVELSVIRKNNYQLDLDVKNVFNGLGNSTLIFKKKYQSGKLVDVNGIKLIRFLATINNQISFTKDPTRLTNDTTMVGLHPSDILEFSLGIGFEKQIMHKNFVHYFGIDAIFSLSKYDDDVSNAIIGGVIYNLTSTTDRLVSVYKSGINPFFGIKYYFTDRLSIGIETGIQIVYYTSKITELVYKQTIINGINVKTLTERTPFFSHGLITTFNNLRFVTIGYVF